MAVLWERVRRGVCYQVRGAGRTRRLYTDGVLHSQYNPAQLLTGGVWDLLMLPAFFCEAGSIRRVLLLGVAGGAAVHLLRRYLGPQQISAIELNRTHIELGKRFFGLQQPGVRLVNADAVKWLQRYQGPPFDMIIDDLFGGADGEPQRAVKASGPWMRLLTRHLSREGVLVMNFISPKELRGGGIFSNKALARQYATAFELSNRLEENAVGAFVRQPATLPQLLRRLAAQPRLVRAWDRGELCSRVRRLRLPESE